MDRIQTLLLPLGRILLASLFILGGINKIMNYALTLAMMSEAGLPFAQLLLPLTIALELGGGIIVAIGRRFAAPVALLLAGYTLAVNLVFHAFWALNGTESAIQLSLFFKNLSIIGGLLFVAGVTLAQSADNRNRL
jgi:putative oxidoreductase